MPMLTKNFQQENKKQPNLC